MLRNRTNTLPAALLFMLVIVGFAPLLVPTPATAQDGDGTQATPSGAPFRVALSGRYPPFSFYSEEGLVQGFDVDTAREVGRRLGRSTEIIATEWAGIIPGLQSDRYDAIIGSMAITQERAEQVRFSEPYYISGAQLFVHESQVDQYPDLDAFTNELIGVGVGSTYQQFLTSQYPHLNIRLYPGEAEMFLDMRTGRLSAFVTDRLVGMYNIEQSGLEFVPAGPLLYAERCAIPVRIGNEDLRDQINEALVEMVEDGFFDSLHLKWFGSPPDMEAIAGIPDISEFDLESTTQRRILLTMLQGFMITLYVAFFSITVGFLLAIPIGVGINNGPKALRWLLIGFSDVIRGTPVLVQLFFFYYGLGTIEALRMTALQAGILAMTINAAAYMGEVVRAGLISVHPGQVTGATALGLSKFQAFRFVVWPQAFRIMVPPLMNSVVALLKDTALVSVIGVAELVTETNRLAAATYRTMELWLIVGAMFFIVAFPLMKAAQLLEDRMRRRGYQMEK